MTFCKIYQIPSGLRDVTCGVRHAANFTVAAIKKSIGSLLDPGRYVRAGGAAIRRVVLKAAIARRIVRRRCNQRVRKMRMPATIVGKNRPRHDRNRSKAIVVGYQCFDAIRG